MVPKPGGYGGTLRDQRVYDLAGPAGTGINVLGIDTIANIIVKVAVAIGDAWVSSDAGFDDFGVPVIADDVIRAIAVGDAGWSNIGPLQGPQGVQG